MKTVTAVLGFCLLASIVDTNGRGPAGRDPLGFFEPTIVPTSKERRRLEQGEPVVRVLPAQGNTVAVFGAVPVSMASDRFVAWMRDIVALKRTPRVEAIQRFSTPPRIEDLAGLVFDDVDLTSVRECKPARCKLKLSAAEVADAQRAPAPAAALQDALRRVVLRRVELYLAGGHAALPANSAKTAPPTQTFRVLLDGMTFLTRQLPDVASALVRWPAHDGAAFADAESFLYWSKERVGSKSIVSVTQVFILRRAADGGPEVLVLGKQLFATHYIDGAIDAVVLAGANGDAARYLVYVNQTSVDMLSGFWGGVVRHVVEDTVSDELPKVLRGVRARMQGGAPPTRAQ